MTITIQTPQEMETTVTQAAAREGLSIEEFALRALLLQTRAFETAYQSDPWLDTQDDWERLLLAVAADHEGLPEPIPPPATGGARVIGSEKFALAPPVAGGGGGLKRVVYLIGTNISVRLSDLNACITL